jgi:hypothetical protein
VLAVSKTAAEGILRVDDELHLTPLEPVADDPKVSKLRAALDRRVGEAQLPELILAVDAEVRFSWIMLGREPRSSKELLMVYAGILSCGSVNSSSNAISVARPTRRISFCDSREWRFIDSPQSASKADGWRRRLRETAESHVSHSARMVSRPIVSNPPLDVVGHGDLDRAG